MLNLSFFASLFCLLPFFVAVSVIPIQLNPRFLRFSAEVPCVWSDGAVSLNKGKVSISVGPKSALLVYSERKVRELLSKVKATRELSQPDSYIFIATEKDNVHHTIEEHNDFIHRFAYQVFHGEGIEFHKDEQSPFDVAVLRTIHLDPEILADDLETFINTENIFNSTELLQILDPEMNYILALEDTALIEDKFETENNLLKYFNVYSPQPVVDIEANLFLRKAEVTSGQDTLIQDEDTVNAEIQLQSSGNNPNGEQFKFENFDEPMIYNSKCEARHPQFVSSLTGEILQRKNRNWEPLTGKNRIPDDTKMLIVNMGSYVKYYKNITKGSKVWYLQRDEKVFYPCIVRFFSFIKCPKPTLECIGHEPQKVRKVSWNDIFPIESTILIKDLGEFKIQRENINWAEILPQNETDLTLPEEREEQYFYKDLSIPFFVHRKPSDNEWIIIDSGSGKFSFAEPQSLAKIQENDPRRIPNETKMTADRNLKLIVLDSEIYYYWKQEGVLIRGRVASIHDKKVTFKSINGKLFRKVEWVDTYPIESYELIKDLAPLWTPRTFKALPRKREYTDKEKVPPKEQRIDDGASVGNLVDNNDIRTTVESFCAGDQLSYKGKVDPPFIFLSAVSNGKQFMVLDPMNGKIRHLCRNSMKSPANPQIPIDTKISEDGKSKIIVPKSHILYRHSDGKYYPCAVKAFTPGRPLNILCETLGEFSPSWNEIFPIEALPTLPEPLKIHGFDDAKTVTLGALRDKIDAIPRRRPSRRK